MFLLVPYAVSRSEISEVHAEEKQEEVATTTPAVPPTVKELISKYALHYGVSEAKAMAIADCESKFDPMADNPHSTASGVFQFLRGTWATTLEGKEGVDVFEAEPNIRAGVRMLSQVGAKPWRASYHCHGYWN